MKNFFKTLLFFCLISSFFPSFVLAQEFTSSSFRVLDPVVSSSGYATSSGFQLWGNVGQISLGTSTASSFYLNSGFLTFPHVTTPVVSASGGTNQISLSWTASDGFLGWTVSGYDVGYGTSSGGPYAYENAGNVLSHAVSSLNSATTYYLIVLPKDAFGNRLATSTEVSATTSSGSGSGGGSGGGGGGGIISTAAVFSGRAYPRSVVTLLKDAQVAASTVAGTDAKFQISLSNLTGGNYIFSVYGEDKDGNRSSLLTFPVSVTSGATTNVSGIFIAPSISADKSEVKKGDNLAIFGQSSPASSILIEVNSEHQIFASATTDSSGVYLYNLDTSPLEFGDHSAKSKASFEQEISSFGKSVAFLVGTKNVALAKKKSCPAKGDVNDDCLVNLVDFSITAYWYKRVLTGSFVEKEKSKLSDDKKINLKDFSIMAFYWTG